MVNCKKMIDIFDHYWDHYRHDFINVTQTEGSINPKLWNDETNLVKEMSNGFDISFEGRRRSR